MSGVRGGQRQRTLPGTPGGLISQLPGAASPRGLSEGSAGSETLIPATRGRKRIEQETEPLPDQPGDLQGQEVGIVGFSVPQLNTPQHSD